MTITETIKPIKIATVCSGIGSPEQALKELDIDHDITFACEIDKYARQTYLANFQPKTMLTDMTKEDWVGEQFYSDLFIGGIPCQAFSLAGKRMGELDHRGLLFYDFYRYVKNQQPKVFIIENVKGLLSDNNGVTFQNWVQLLGQSMNTHYNMFNHEDSLLYNLHFKVLNSKDFGVPQNRERVFLIGIRNDLPNTFRFPKGERLKIRLKDILEPIVDEKYYLSETLIDCFKRHTERHKAKGNGFEFEPTDGNKIANCVSTRSGQRPDDDFIYVSKEIRTDEAKAERKVTGSNGFRNKEVVFEQSETVGTIQTGLTKDNLILVTEATKKGYAEATDGDNISLSNPESKTRRGRVGKGVANTLDTSCNQAVVVNDDNWVLSGLQNHQTPRTDGLSPTLTSAMGMGGGQTPVVKSSHRIRRLTPLECMRLQGYPDEYVKPCSDTQTYKQAGNSITVKVMKALIENLIPIL